MTIKRAVVLIFVLSSVEMTILFLSPIVLFRFGYTHIFVGLPSSEIVVLNPIRPRIYEHVLQEVASQLMKAGTPTDLKKIEAKYLCNATYKPSLLFDPERSKQLQSVRVRIWDIEIQENEIRYALFLKRTIQPQYMDRWRNIAPNGYYEQAGYAVFDRSTGKIKYFNVGW